MRKLVRKPRSRTGARSRKNPDAMEQLRKKLSSRTAQVGVMGLGHVGLPLAAEFARAGFHVTGIEVDERKVSAIQKGESYIGDVSSTEVARLGQEGLLQATTNYGEVARLDTINICVPTPLRKTKDPDMSFILGAVEQNSKESASGMLVVLESTTYPGTTEELVLPRLEETGLEAGRDFFLCFSPERVDPGNQRFTTRNIPKVVGGVTPACSELGALFYRQALETVVPVSSPRVAEMVKLLENTFRSINIGLANEMALLCDRMKIDGVEVIEAAATKPSGSCRSFRVRGWAGTAFRWTRSICRGRRNWTGRRSGSSSWPGRSTGPCRGLW